MVTALQGAAVLRADSDAVSGSSLRHGATYSTERPLAAISKDCTTAISLSASQEAKSTTRPRDGVSRQDERAMNASGADSLDRPSVKRQRLGPAIANRRRLAMSMNRPRDSSTMINVATAQATPKNNRQYGEIRVRQHHPSPNLRTNETDFLPIRAVTALEHGIETGRTERRIAQRIAAHRRDHTNFATASTAGCRSVLCQGTPTACTE